MEFFIIGLGNDNVTFGLDAGDPALLLTVRITPDQAAKLGQELTEAAELARKLPPIEG